MELVLAFCGAGSGLLILTVKTPEGSKTAEVSEVAISATVVAISAGRTVVAGSIGSSIFPFLHNLLIGLLNFFEFGFSLIFVGIIDIGIRVILPAERAVSFFDVIVGGTL